MHTVPYIISSHVVSRHDIVYKRKRGNVERVVHETPTVKIDDENEEKERNGLATKFLHRADSCRGK